MKNTTSTKWNDIKSKITMCGLLVLKDGEAIERKMLSCDKHIDDWFRRNLGSLQEQAIFLLMTAKRFAPESDVKVQLVVACHDDTYTGKWIEVTGAEEIIVVSEYTYSPNHVTERRICEETFLQYDMSECTMIITDSAGGYFFLNGDKEVIEDIEEYSDKVYDVDLPYSDEYITENGKVYDVYRSGNFLTLYKQ